MKYKMIFVAPRVRPRAAYLAGITAVKRAPWATNATPACAIPNERFQFE